MSKPPFEKFADEYASSRPGYPDDIKSFLFDLFDVGSDSCIADVACGSGIFTQLLSCDGNIGCVVGLDRSLPLIIAGMNFFKEFCFKPLCSRGETLPLKSKCCDLVTVAQGFHWMNRQESLAEINRILKPSGGIALIWYRRKTLTEPHQAFIERLTHKYNPNYDPEFMDADYVGMLFADGRFTDIGQKRFYASRIYNLESYIKWQRSKSFIGDAMEEDMLEEFLEKVSREIDRFFPDGIITEEFKYDLIYGRRK